MNLLDFNKDKLNLKKGIVKKDITSADDIAIIGMSVKFPMADDIEEYWSNIVNGVDCVRKIPDSRKKDVEQYVKYHQNDYNNIEYSELAYIDWIDKFDHEFFGLSPKEASLMDPNQRLFLQVAWNAIEDAGYAGKGIKSSKTGVYVGFGGELLYSRLIDEFEPSSKDVSIPGNIIPIIASRISYVLDLKGPSVIVDTACSSSLVAVHLACSALRNKECSMALAGSVKINLLPLAGSIALGIESSDGRTRSFDDSSDGSGLGEGVAAILLKPLNKAVEDGDNIYAVIKGSSINQDGSSIGITAPNPKAQEEVIVQAWKDAGVEPETISYIEAHGTGTELGDPIEIDGIERAFRRFTDKKQFCAIGTVKTNIGHLENASGLAGLIKAVLALKHQMIPPTINFSKPNRKISFHKSPVFINNTLSEWVTEGYPRRCGVSSFGLSGTNCHLVLEEFSGKPSFKDSGNKRLRAFTISAKSDRALMSLIKNCAATLKVDEVNVDDLCFTSNVGRGHYNYRVAVIVHSLEDLKEKLDYLSNSELDLIQKEGIYYGKFRLVTVNKVVRETNELTEEEIRNLSKAASNKLMEFVSHNYNDGNKLGEVCSMYVNGADVNWEEGYRGQEVKRERLPLYPFEPSRCWIQIPDTMKHAHFEEGSLYHTMVWSRSVLGVKDSSKQGGSILILKDVTDEQEYFCQAITSRLKENSNNIIEVGLGIEFQKIDDSSFIVNGSKEDFGLLLDELKEKDLKQILFLSGIDGKMEFGSVADLEDIQRKSVYSLLNVFKALISHDINRDIDVVLISWNVNEVTGIEDNIHPEQAALFGLGKVIGLENLYVKCRCVDIDASTEADKIVSEIMTKSGNYQVAYREGNRYIEEIKSIDLDTVENNALSLKRTGVYIIAGGCGGVGLEISKNLASSERVKLAFINRSPIPIRDEWDKIISEGTEKEICKKIRYIREIEKMGATVECYCADISNEKSLETVLNDLRAKYGAIHGVINSTGISALREGKTLEKVSHDEFDQILKAKVQGTWLLSHLTENDPLDFFINFSSTVTLTGRAGAGDFTAANSYLDAFSAYRRKKGLKALTVNWYKWDSMSREPENAEDESGHLFKSLSDNNAIQAFGEIFSKNINRIIVGRMNYASDLFSFYEYLPFALSQDIRSDIDKVRQKQGRNILDTDIGGSSVQVKLEGNKGESYSIIERQVAQVWGNVLGLSQINIYDNFYELGGNSIMAIRIVNGLLSSLGVKIEVTDLLKYPNFYEFAENIGRKRTNNTQSEDIYLSLQPMGESEYYPVSAAQRRMLILKEIEGKGTSYNNPSIMLVEGELDIERFKGAFKLLVERHEPLRTSFHMVGDEWIQRIHKDIHLDIEYFEAEESNKDQIIKDFIRPFDLKKAPLMRVGLIRTAKDRYVFMYDIHHVISDGESMNIIMEELADICQGKELPKLSLQYKDFSVWQNRLIREGVFKKQEDYWKSVFSGEIPVLNLPLDKARPSIRHFEGDKIKFTMDASLFGRLNQLSLETGSTMYMVLMAALNAILYKYTEQEDIVVGSPVSGRAHTSLESILGIFINTLAIRNYPQGKISFREFVEQVRENALRAYENQDLPFEKLLEILDINRDLSRNPLFDVAFFYHNAALQNINTNGLKFSPYSIDTSVSKFDLTLNAIEYKESMDLELEYSTDLFMRSTIERMSVHLLALLEACVKNPDQKLEDIQIMTDKERYTVMDGFNHTAREYDRDRSLPQIFEEQVKKTPDQIAVMFADMQYTYDLLNCKANQLAWILRGKNIKTDHIIAIMVERSINMIVSILGVLKAGGAYLPLDPDYPLERIEYILEDSGADILITQKSLSGNISFKGDILLVEDASIGCADVSNPPYVNRPDDLAYVIYTSGSTGKPKGVMLEHMAVHNFMNGVADKIDFSSGKTILCLTTISFDIFVLETLLPLTRGMKVLIADETQQKNPALLNAALIKYKVDMLQATPSRMQMLLEDHNSNKALEVLKEIMIGGEAFPQSLLENLNKQFIGKIYNMYGPTETTVWSTIRDLTGEDRITIGKPIANTRVYILDHCSRLQPIGLPGELYIAGDSLARGYLNKIEMTKDRFVPDPFKQGELMYRTGDVTRWLEDGNIEFLGRTDYQVKINGYRIELGEIESCIREIDSVKDAVVTDRKGSRESGYLCAYVVLKNKKTLADIKQHLTKKLPVYMIPSYFMELEKLPLTPNGKVDKKALLALEIDTSVHGEDLFPKSEIEIKIFEIWRNVLGTENININQNFFQIGGNSVKAILLQVGLEEKFSKVMKISDIYLYPTIKEQASYIEKESGVGNPQRGTDIKDENFVKLSDKLSEMDLDTKTAEVNKSFYMETEGVKKLTGIKPFNDFFYKSCFFNSLFPVVQFYDKDILPFIVNDVLAYHLEDIQSGKSLNAEYIGIKSAEDIIGDVGIDLKKKMYNVNIIEEIIESISYGNPVIVWVDCYYESLRKDLFQKRHHPHTWLIYGFDRQQKVFNIIEHTYTDSLTYNEYMISFSELLCCYEGFLNNHSHTIDSPSYFEFGKSSDNMSEDAYFQHSSGKCRDILLNNLHEKKGAIYQGLEEFNVFIHNFERMTSDESEFRKYAENAESSLNNIINIKQAERYRVKKIFIDNPELVEKIESILDHWYHVRAYTLKTAYMRSYKKDNPIKILEILMKIHQTEIEFNGALFTT